MTSKASSTIETFIVLAEDIGELGGDPVTGRKYARTNTRSEWVQISSINSEEATLTFGPGQIRYGASDRATHWGLLDAKFPDVEAEARRVAAQQELEALAQLVFDLLTDAALERPIIVQAVAGVVAVQYRQPGEESELVQPGKTVEVVNQSNGASQ